VYANRPERSTHPALSGCGYGTKVVSGAVLSAGVLPLIVLRVPVEGDKFPVRRDANVCRSVMSNVCRRCDLRRVSARVDSKFFADVAHVWRYLTAVNTKPSPRPTSVSTGLPIYATEPHKHAGAGDR
jgi:hypothetical protein